MVLVVSVAELGLAAIVDMLALEAQRVEDSQLNLAKRHNLTRATLGEALKWLFVVSLLFELARIQRIFRQALQ